MVEPEAAWAALPDASARASRADANGYEHVVVGDTEILAVPLGNLARPGSTFHDPATFRPLADALPGGWDPALRLADMDAEGIDQAVLYPTIGLYFSVVPDPAAAVGPRRGATTTGWPATARRIPAGCSAPPCSRSRTPRRPPASCAAPSASSASWPGSCGPTRASAARCPTAPTTSSGRPPRSSMCRSGSTRAARSSCRRSASDRPFNPLILHAVSHSFEEMLACAQLIAFGVLERHPALRVVFLESSGGWAPFWLERLDEQAESFGGFCPDLELRPSEYFARQCAISFEVDEQTLPALAPFVGPERIVWGSDYPHHDATFPGAVDALRRTIAPCPTATQAKVLGLNARGIYRLPSRHVGPAGIIGDYFAAVTAHDADLLRTLFAPDATFDVDGDVRRGHEQILAYYTERTFTFDDFRPSRNHSRSRARR